MTSDVAVPDQITDPDTGEVIASSDVAGVADLYRRLDAYLDQWKDAKAWCRAAIIAAADERHEWRLALPGMDIHVDPPSHSDIDWDIDELHKLESLMAPERYGELVVLTITEKPQTGKLHTLARQAGEDSVIAQIISRAERRKPKTRYVRFAR
jgi:hypothetical protein